MVSRLSSLNHNTCLQYCRLHFATGDTFDSDLRPVPQPTPTVLDDPRSVPSVACRNVLTDLHSLATSNLQPSCKPLHVGTHLSVMNGRLVAKPRVKPPETWIHSRRVVSHHTAPALAMQAMVVIRMFGMDFRRRCEFLFIVSWSR